MTPETRRAVRADAARNRERLLDAARRAFASGADPVPLESVAREAGVGIGTLYRHFPTREALVEAVYRAELSRLREGADELLAEHGPAVALRLWMDRFAGFMTTKRGMLDTLRAMMASGTIASADSRERLLGTVRALLDAAAEAGAVRRDVRPDDVLASLTGIVLATGPEGQAQAARMMDLLMDGLRPRPGS